MKWLNMMAGCDLDIEIYFKEILLEEYHSMRNMYTEKRKTFSIDMINQSTLLSDKFIDPSFKISDLQPFFAKNTWNLVNKMIVTKINESTCPSCNELCMDESIQCNYCEFWYHFKCAGKIKALSSYERSGRIKKWNCSKHGFECNSIKTLYFKIHY